MSFGWHWHAYSKRVCMAKILILYSTVDGHTFKICQRLQQVIEQDSHHVELLPISDREDLDLESFDKVVIGASIRYGKYRPNVIDFIKHNQTILASKKSAFFSVNAVARKPEKNQPETNPYVRSLFKKITWQPDAISVFAGKINYPKYNFVDLMVIRLIMWLTHGPTDPKACVDFTDWTKVDEFGRLISEM
jgi:menaquinone-dependent protoporphyrinogen oxidase